MRSKTLIILILFSCKNAYQKAAPVLKNPIFLMVLGTLSFILIAGLKLGLVIAVCIFFHEQGHMQAMKWFGMQVKGIFFIPFLGAVAVSKEEFPSADAQAGVLLMGPFGGLLFAGVCYVAYLSTGYTLCAYTAAVGGVINLINLIPFFPLDGGRFMHTISRSFPLSVSLVTAPLIVCAYNIALFDSGKLTIVIGALVPILMLLMDHASVNKKIALAQERLAFYQEWYEECLVNFPPDPDMPWREQTFIEVRENISKIEKEIKGIFSLIPLTKFRALGWIGLYLFTVIALWKLLLAVHTVPEVATYLKLVKFKF